MSDPNHHSQTENEFDATESAAGDEPLSKSELKRQAAEFHKLGDTLVNLTPAQRGTIPMDPELQDAVTLATKINRKKDGYRRQLQFIGKLLRQRDTAPIEQALVHLNQQHQAANAAFHALEQTREDIVSRGDPAIQELVEEHPALDRQKLRQFHRQVKKEREKNAPPKAFRELFQYLKETIGDAG